MRGLIIRESELDPLKAEFFLRLERFTDAERQRIRAAVDWATELHQDQKRASGEPYIIHPLQVAAILAELKMDAPTVIAGLLHDVLEDTPVTKAILTERFGEEVESLVDGVTKIHILHAKTKSVQEAETIRKMFFAMIKDIRVIMIKLADKVHNMSTLQHLPEHKIKRIATECLDIYAPLAGRLGISSVKNQLEDLSLKHLDKDAYYQIKAFVDSKRGEREAYLVKVQEDILRLAHDEGLEISVDARAKHFYSIYSKWKKGKDLAEVFDMLGIRIYCQSPTDCYTLLGVVHRLWKPIEGRFKDYIAMPKDNGYQSLHTTVMGWGGRLTEIQIRTYDMHKTAEYGIAAHWVYKQGSAQVNPNDLAIVARLKSWQEELVMGDNFLDEIKGELLKDSIYVFTPKGKVVELPTGATALDFAYAIHTEVGNHTFAAKADGSIIPLTQELKNTQVIEIITSNNSHPHLNWLRACKTHRAKSKIKHYLAHSADGLIVDRNIVAKTPTAKTPPPQPVSEPKVDHRLLPDDQEAPVQHVMDPNKVGVRLGDERNFMIKFALCCNPITGDPIIGFVSRGRGIIIHRTDCPNLAHIPGIEQRRVDVEWETVSPKVTRRFRLVAKRGADLFSEIEGTLRKHKGHLIEGKLEDDHLGHLVGTFTVELDDKDDTQKILKALRAIPTINTIQKID